MTGFEKFCLKLIRTEAEASKLLGTSSQYRSQTWGFVPGPHWRLLSPDHDSTQAG